MKIHSLFHEDNIFSMHANLTDGPCRAKTCLRASADSHAPDHPAHPRSLIRTIAVRKQNPSDVDPHILRMREGTFSLDAAHILLKEA